MKHSKLRTAMIGTGGISGHHLAAIRENADIFELCGFFDPDAERAEAFRTKAGLETVAGSLAELLDQQKPDIVQICTPPAYHADLSIEAMEAGAHVLCEKPLCGSLADMHRIMEAEQRTGKWCASVFQMRYGAGSVHLKNLMREGELGSPLVGICHTLWYRDNEYYEVPWRGTWRNELGGPTVGHGIHIMDHFLSLLGDWSEVRADIGTLDRPIEIEDVSMAIVRFRNGAMGSIVNSILSPRQESYLRMDFQKATVELSHLYRYDNENWKFSPAVGTDEAFGEKLRTIGAGGLTSHGTQMKALAEDIRLGRKPETSGVSAEATIELLTAIYKSALTERPVTRGSIRSDDPFYHSFHGGMSVSHRRIPSLKNS